MVEPGNEDSQAYRDPTESSHKVGKSKWLCSWFHYLPLSKRTPMHASMTAQNIQRKQIPSVANSLHASSAVNANDLSVDPVTVLGGKEADNAGNVYWLANTVVRGPCLGVLVDLVVAELITAGDVLAADGVVHVGLDTTGSHAVDSDLLLASI
jgi:hypothetical protein